MGQGLILILKELAEKYATLRREKVRKELKELFEAELEDVKLRRWTRVC